ncbi:hypothetical protein ABDJ41_16060 [Pedobacter sp. ASV1-7]|uniref:hypothetical protein n=1 Tax=Pedobacter sp. ASV1-7 TaxID=3145237 RepID=UPI0032E8DDC2
MTLYHSSNNDLAPGDIIPPGNWGKMVFYSKVDHHLWKREMTIEAMRIWNFAEKPSRLKCAFACDNLDTMVCYHVKENPEGFIYQVEAVDPHAPMHKGDFNAVGIPKGYPDNMWGIASRYWGYDLKTHITEWPGIECSEILVGSGLRVIRKISEEIIKKKAGELILPSDPA